MKIKTVSVVRGLVALLLFLGISGFTSADTGGYYVSITGYKFYDANTNGVWDAGESAIRGWEIEKTPPTPADETYTNASGQYKFVVAVNSGDYTITEVFPTGGWTWINTTPTSGVVTVGGSNVYGPDFGNVCFCSGGTPKTIGFWSNKNGQALFGDDDLALMVSLNLRNADGTNFDPADYAAFRTWLLDASATNMAYMLSAQLAGMELNVLNGMIANAHNLIYAPGTNSANAAGFASLSDVLEEANTELGVHGTAYAGDPWRSYQEALKDALDNANNGLTFVRPTPCKVRY